MNKNEGWKNDLDAAAEAYVQRDDIARERRERLERMKQEAGENAENHTIYFQQLEKLLKAKEEELDKELSNPVDAELIEKLTEARDQMKAELEKARTNMDEAEKANEKAAADLADGDSA